MALEVGAFSVRCKVKKCTIEKDCDFVEMHRISLGFRPVLVRLGVKVGCSFSRCSRVFTLPINEISPMFIDKSTSLFHAVHILVCEGLHAARIRVFRPGGGASSVILVHRER